MAAVMSCRRRNSCGRCRPGSLTGLATSAPPSSDHHRRRFRQSRAARACPAREGARPPGPGPHPAPVAQPGRLLLRPDRRRAAARAGDRLPAPEGAEGSRADRRRDRGAAHLLLREPRAAGRSSTSLSAASSRRGCLEVDEHVAATETPRLPAGRPAPPNTGEAAVVAKLSTLDRFLPLWIALAMAAGLVLGTLVPSLNDGLDRLRVGTVSAADRRRAAADDVPGAGEGALRGPRPHEPRRRQRTAASSASRSSSPGSSGRR